MRFIYVCVSVLPKSEDIHSLLPNVNGTEPEN